MKIQQSTQMKERPIIFNAEMVKAILRGSKFQTRRTNGLETVNEYPREWEFREVFTHCAGIERPQYDYRFEHSSGEQIDLRCPFGKKGDRLWVRETFSRNSEANISLGMPEYLYRADGAIEGTYKPCIFMPRRASRILLEITDVQVECLLEITSLDSLAEGVEGIHIGDMQYRFRYYMSPAKVAKTFTMLTPRQSFQSLWEFTFGRSSWWKNPWVWVVSFKIL